MLPRSWFPQFALDMLEWHIKTNNDFLVCVCACVRACSCACVRVRICMPERFPWYLTDDLNLQALPHAGCMCAGL